MDTFDAVQEFIVENFLYGERAKLTPDTSFLQSGIIDSTGILELISFLEEKYLIRIQDNELVPENFDTLNRISDYLKRKLDHKGVA